MTRLEISGYVQIVVGFVGIVVTLLTAPSILDAFGQVATGGGLPEGFNTVSGAIRVFAVMLILGVLLLLVGAGASITLSTLFKIAGATHPMLSASCLLLGVFGMAASATFGIFRHALWVPAFVGSFGALMVSVTAAREQPQSEASGVVAGVFIIIFLMTGIGTLGAINAAEDDDLLSNMASDLNQ